MTITIVDEQLDEQLTESSAAVGQSVEEFVAVTLRRSLGIFENTPVRKIDLEAIRRIQQEVASMPILDSRSADEIIGYNERGTFD